MRFTKCLYPFLAVALIAGCAQDKKTQQAEAAKQWRDARAAVQLSLARDQYKNGNFDESRASVNQAIKLAPDNVAARVLSAKLAIEQGQLELAEHELSAARKSDGKNAEIDYLSGVIYQRWQKPETAYEYYVSASEKQPAELAYVMAKSEMLVAMNRETEAVALLQERVNYFEHSATIRDALGQLLVHEGKFAEGIDSLRQATILGPDDLTVREHFALALYLGHQYREAIECLNKLIENDANAKRADLLVTLGECQLQVGDIHAARRTLDNATQIDTNLAPAWLGLGRVCLQMGEIHRADYATGRAIALDPTNSESQLLMGYLRLQEKKLDEALAAFQQAAKADHEDTVALCMIGYTLEKMGKSTEAERCYAEALKIKPADQLANRLMASISVTE